MEINAQEVKRLRDITGSGMMEAKGALTEAGGDFDKAVAILKERGATIAAAKTDRVVANGVVASYVHNNRIGVVVEVLVETDFVARDPKFVEFAKEIAVHIAGMSPKYLKESDIPADELAAADNQAEYVKEVCLLNQPFVKDPGKTIADLVNEQVGSFKENIQIGRFSRIELGGEVRSC